MSSFDNGIGGWGVEILVHFGDVVCGILAGRYMGDNRLNASPEVCFSPGQGSLAPHSFRPSRPICIPHRIA